MSERKIYCSPRDCVALRVPRTEAELDWAAEVSAYYVARPLKSDALHFYTFVADVFAAGRISGVREERERRREALKGEESA